MPIRPIEIMEKHTYDPDKDGRIGKDALEWAVNHLLIGAGDGADPNGIIPGSLAATCVVVANDTEPKLKTWAQILQAVGYPVWVCDGAGDEVEIQAAHDALPIYGRLLCLDGTYNLANPVVWTKSNTTFDCYGQLKPTGTCAFQLGSTASPTTYLVDAFIKTIDGVNKSPDGIQIICAGLGTIRLGRIVGCNRAILFPQNGKEKGETYFHYNQIAGCNYAVLFEAPHDSYDDFMEGCQFHGGFIQACSHGIVASKGSDSGWGYVEGVIDCGNISDSYDAEIYSGGWVFNVKYIRSDRAFYPPSTFIAIRSDKNQILPKYASAFPLSKQRDYTNWSSSASGSGSVSKGIDQCILQTGATASSSAICYKLLRSLGVDLGNLNYEIILFCEFMPVYDVANSIWYFKVDDDINPTDPDSKAFGFKLENFTLKGIVHSGTTLYITDLNTTLAHGAPHSLVCRFIKGQRIQWFVDDELKGEDTAVSHLPSGILNNAKIVTCVTNGSTAAQKEIRSLIECETKG